MNLDKAAYLTFDLGTSALKTALVTDDGRVSAVHTFEYTPQAPRPGWAEMPPDAYWQAAVTVPPGCDGLTLLPHFAGSNMPSFNPHVGGAFISLRLGHTRTHLARAIVEACANMSQECLEPIERHNISITRVRSLGGGAHSDAWFEMKADLVSVPVERPACAEAASLGAAMLPVVRSVGGT